MKKSKDKIITLIILIALICILAVFSIISLNAYNYQIKGTISKIEKVNDIDETYATIIEMSDDNNYVYINKAGTYVISGVCNDGFILVNAKRQNIYLVLDNLTLTSLSTSCIIVDDANIVFLNLKKDTINTLNDANKVAYYTVPSGNVKESKGCIYSKDNLTINGTGTLYINGNYSNGIACNDSLTIYSSNIIINSVTHGINVNEAFVTDSANITITSGKDGIHSINRNNPSKNYCTILGGTININSNGDGIDSSGDLGISDGEITITSNKTGLLCTSDIIIKGGKISITSNNSSISGDIVAISGGTIDLITNNLVSSIKAEELIHINGGEIYITSNGYGLYSNSTIVIKKGYIKINKATSDIVASSITIKGGTIENSNNDD